MIQQMCVFMCVLSVWVGGAHMALTNEPGSVKWLVIRTHWRLIASHYHLKVSGG